MKKTLAKSIIAALSLALSAPLFAAVDATVANAELGANSVNQNNHDNSIFSNTDINNYRYWYVGGGVNYSAETRNEMTGTNNYKLTLASNNIGGSIFAGFRANQYFALELGGVWLGESKYNLRTSTSGGQTVNDAVSLDGQYNVHIVGNFYFPLTSWFEPYAFGGVTYSNSRIDVATVGTDTGFTETDSAFGLLYGAGLQFNIEHFIIRASYTRQNLQDSNSNGDNPLPEQAQDYVSLEVAYRF